MIIHFYFCFIVLVWAFSSLRLVGWILGLGIGFLCSLDTWPNSTAPIIFAVRESEKYSSVSVSGAKERQNLTLSHRKIAFNLALNR